MKVQHSQWETWLNWRWFGLLVITLIWALAYLPELGARDLRLEEGRRATPAREMLQTGDYVTPRLYGEPYLNKPPGYFWLVAGVGAIQGHVDSLAVRVPSVLAILFGAWILASFPDPRLSRTTRNLAAIFLLANFVCLDKGILGEIDAALSTLIIGAIAIWWHGEARGRITVWHWIGVGLVMSFATLTKGPPAMILFYIPVAAYLLWQKRAKELFSLGHIACFILIVLPFVLWVLAVQVSSHLTWTQLFAEWRVQLGADKVTPTAGHLGKKLVRYAIFPLEAASGFLPWVLPLPLLLIRRVREGLGIPQSLYRFLVGAILATWLFFWLWPTGRPRHMMMVIFPVCLLAAALIVSASRWPRGPGIRIHLHSARLAAIVLGISSLVALGLAIGYFHHAIAGAAVLVLVGIVGGVLLYRSAVKDWLWNPTLTVALNWSAVLLMLWAIAAVVYWPYKAEGLGANGVFFTSLTARPDEPRALVAQFDHLPSESKAPRFTMLRYKGLAEGFYNLIFYFGEKLTAVTSPEQAAAQNPQAIVFMSEKQYDKKKESMSMEIVDTATLDRRTLDDGSAKIVAVRVIAQK